ncbi:hypothetical protein [Streptomyces sp. NPDC008121]|uniref:hypothetical protein n=1 Tax=Streptomyces sp. NPDC008121 TaxID=3364809 RepID=UPI0036DFD023
MKALLIAAVSLSFAGMITPAQAAAVDPPQDQLEDCSQKCISVGVINHSNSIMVMQKESLAQQYLTRPSQVIGKAGDDATSDFWTAPAVDGAGRESVYAFGSGGPLFVHFTTTVTGDTSTSACYFTQPGSGKRVAPSNTTCRAVSGKNASNPDITIVYYSVNGSHPVVRG